MNSAKQLWSLLKFQCLINPFIWFMPIAFSGTSWIPLVDGHAHERPLSSALDNFQLFMVGFLCVMVLAPDIFYSSPVQNMWASGTEFLLTRATDRKAILRSRSVLLYVLVLMVPVVLLLLSLKDSTLQTEEYSKALREACVAALPGTTLIDDKNGSADQLVIPNGNALLGSWNLWTTLLVAMASQVIIWTIYPLKYRRYIFWAIYGAVILWPLFLIGRSIAEFDRLDTTERLFLAFAPHQIAAWALTLLAALLIQLWCERRFARLEQ